MDEYRNRVNFRGNSLRKRIVKRDQDMIVNHLPNNPSYKEVKYGDDYIYLSITTKNKLTNDEKNFATLPNFHIDRGEIIEWNDGYWMVMSHDSDEEIYERGKLKRCNYDLQWLNENRDIITRRCIVDFPYAASVNRDYVVTINSTKCLIYIPFDDETKKITMGKRFFITRNADHPVPYSVENVNDVANVFHGHGYLVLSMKQDQLIVGVDNEDLLICDYKTKEIQEYSTLQSKIKVVPMGIIPEYKSGTKITAVFYRDEEEVDDVAPLWDIQCDFLNDLDISYSENNKVINIKTNNRDLLGRQVIISLTDENEEYEPFIKTIDVRAF